MKLLLLSDIHSGTDSNYPNRKGSDYTNSFGEKLEASIAQLKEIASMVDLIVNLGDFIHEISLSEDQKQYQKSKNLLGSFGKPILHVAGNHDLVYMNRDILAHIWGTDTLYYYRDIEGYRHIILDGNRNGNKNGIPEIGQKYRFDSIQLDWLKGVLNDSTLPCVIYSHFPLDKQDVSTNYYWSDSPNPHERAFPEGYLEVRKMLEESKKVIAVFNGHTHFRHQMKIGDILYTNIGGFAENDGKGKATGEYAIADISQNGINVNFGNI